MKFSGVGSGVRIQGSSFICLMTLGEHVTCLGITLLIRINYSVPSVVLRSR